MYLMLKDTPVMEFDLDKGIYKPLKENLLPYQIRGVFTLSDDRELTANELAQNNIKLTHYFATRVLNLSRENAKKILNAYGFSQSQDDYTKAKIAVVCKLISMTDDYWIKDEGSKINWDDVNPKKISLNEVVAHIALSGSSLTITGEPHDPELTGQGAYAKAWVRENNDVYLYKKSARGGIESDIEIMTSKILDCTNVPHVKYENAEFNNEPMCKCKNMISDDYCIVDAEDMTSYCNRTGTSIDVLAKKIDSEMFYKMCVVDYLIANSDRHSKNWGFFMDNSTGDILCIHPLFDHNNAFDEQLMNDEKGGPSLLFQGKTQKEVAEYAIKHCDFRITKEITKDIFISDNMYESFMKRACELNLYKEKEKSGLEKLFAKNRHEYIPVEIKPDNSNDYYKRLPSAASIPRHNSFQSNVSKIKETQAQSKAESKSVSRNINHSVYR